MRRSVSAFAVAFATILMLAACSGKSSSSEQSSAAASAAAEATQAASTQESSAPESSMGAEAGAMASPTSVTIPEYPGATTQSATGPTSLMRTNASGKVLVTSDSFDKVYAWYQQHMPAGSERLHVTQPGPIAAFGITEANSNQDSLTIAVHAGKTVITIAHIVTKKAQ